MVDELKKIIRRGLKTKTKSVEMTTWTKPVPKISLYIWVFFEKEKKAKKRAIHEAG